MDPSPQCVSQTEEQFHLRKKKLEHLEMLDPEGKLSATQLELYEAAM